MDVHSFNIIHTFEYNAIILKMQYVSSNKILVTNITTVLIETRSLK